jgi:GT2 family glycosyltransferase
MARVEIVTVSYKNHGDTKAFLESFMSLRGYEACHVTVVNNAVGSEDESELNRMAEFCAGSVTMVYSPENLYYWGGANLVVPPLLDSKGERGNADWVIVCNNDVLFNDPSFLETLGTYDPSNHGVIAPSIISLATSRDQNPFLRKSPSFLNLIKWRLQYSSFHIAKMLLGLTWVLEPMRRLMRRDGHPDRTRKGEDIFAPHGAFVIFSRRYFETGGRLDTRVPMYMEEISTGAIAEQIGVPVRFCPELQVQHREHATTGSELTRIQWSRTKVGFDHVWRHYLSPRSRRQHRVS